MVLQDKTRIPEMNMAPSCIDTSARNEQTWDDQLPYWREQLAGGPAIRLPGHESGPRDSSRWNICGFEVPPGMTARLAQRADEYGVSSLGLLVAALQIVLARYTGSEDIVVALPAGLAAHNDAAGNRRTPANMVILRSRVTDSASLGDFLRQVRRTITEALMHSSVPFEVLAEELGLGQEPARVVVADERTAELPGTDLTVRVRTGAAGMAGVIKYR